MDVSPFYDSVLCIETATIFAWIHRYSTNMFDADVMYGHMVIEYDYE